MQTAIQKNGFDRVVADIVGDHIKKGKAHDWYRGGSPADMDVAYVALMPSMRMGDVLWEDSKIADIQADYVVNAGVPNGVCEGYGPYSSVMLVDQDRVVSTFTCSSWGGRNALTALSQQGRTGVSAPVRVSSFETSWRRSYDGKGRPWRAPT